MTSHDPNEQPYREPPLGRCRSALGQLKPQTLRIFCPGPWPYLSQIRGLQIRKGRVRDLLEIFNLKPKGSVQNRFSVADRTLHSRYSEVHLPAETSRGRRYRQGHQRSNESHRSGE